MVILCGALYGALQMWFADVVLHISVSQVQVCARSFADAASQVQLADAAPQLQVWSADAGAQLWAWFAATVL